jgi:hypothetical protein
VVNLGIFTETNSLQVTLDMTQVTNNTGDGFGASILLGASACFASGTRIVTPSGDVAVRDLRVGGEVALAHGGTAPVVWLGHRHVDCRRQTRPEESWPVRVRAGAFGEATPRCDVLLLPDHAVFTGGALIPVRRLVNRRRIVRECRDPVTYWHVELPEHAVILAEGLPVESYLDTGDRANFHENGATIRLFPNFFGRPRPDAALVWETRGAAPLVLSGEGLEAARRTSARRPVCKSAVVALSP